MNLDSIRRVATVHRQMNWTGMVMTTADVLGMLQAIDSARCLACKAQVALHDRDLEMVHNFLIQLERLEENHVVDDGSG